MKFLTNGMKTSEFTMTNLVTLMVVAAWLFGKEVDLDEAMLIIGVLQGTYNVSRGMAKREPKPPVS